MKIMGLNYKLLKRVRYQYCQNLTMEDNEYDICIFSLMNMFMIDVFDYRLLLSYNNHLIGKECNKGNKGGANQTKICL